MNKYMEAFITLTDWFHSYRDCNGVIVHERHISEDYENAKKTIKELVEKAIPKKLEKYACPTCHKSVDNLDDSYCKYCGQKFEEWI